MKLIIILLTELLVYMVGFLIGKIEVTEESLKYHRQAAESEIKAARVNMVIRSYRNQLLREETRIRALPKEKQEENALKYIDVKAKLELIRKIEEDVANEMQEI